MERYLRYIWLVLLIVQAAIGVLFYAHYGEGWDDASMLLYAYSTMTAYTNLLRFGTWSSITYPVPVLETYGVWPWVLVILFHKMIPSKHIIDILHLISWAFFLAATVSLYGVLRRWFSEEATLVATLLFATQPLLFGHGFINLKDTSAMSAMLVSLLLGLRFVDALPKLLAHSSSAHSLFPFSFRLHILFSRKVKWGLGLLVAAVMAAFLGLGYAYLVRPSPTEFWYSQFLYIHRVFTVVLAGTVFLIGALGWTWWLQATPEEIIALRLQLREYVQLTLLLVSAPWFWGTVLALGLAVSVRISGWWVWVIILILTWRALRFQSVYPLLLLALMALVVHYITQPALFLGPPSRLLFFYGLALRAASHFPWQGKVLFAGRFYPTSELPRQYVPWLHMIQTTESALLLFVLGLIVLWRRFESTPKQVFVLWYGLPVVLIVLFVPPLYDNARQVLFLLPGLYIPIAAAWEWLRGRLPGVIRTIALVLVITPGVLALVKLHPYQYIYYNSLVGGVRGAFRRYETDYWATSFREVARFLNRYCPTTLPIVVWGPVEPLADFLCPDFTVYSYQEAKNLLPPFYLVVLTRYNVDQCLAPESPTIYQVERQGAVLSVVRYVKELSLWKGNRECLP